MSSAPSTGTPLVDTSVMPTLHTFFRRELRLAGAAVLGVPTATSPGPGGRRPPGFVRRALHHHTSRGRAVWPMLLERVPQELDRSSI